MELRLLEYFLITAREQSMNRAAQVIHISQPSLSRQIAQLEKELGVTLFVRSSHGIQLEGTIGIGCGELKAMKEVARMMKDFQKAHPRVKFNVFTGSADDVSERLQRGLLDMAVLLKPVDLTKYAYIQLKSAEQCGVLMKTDDPLARKTDIEAADLLHRELIVPSRPEVLNDLEHWFGRYYPQMQIRCTDNLAVNNAYLVQEGVGICIMVNSITELLDPSLFVFRPLKPALCQGCVLVWPKDLPLSLAGRKMIAQLKEQYRMQDQIEEAS